VKVTKILIAFAAALEYRAMTSWAKCCVALLILVAPTRAEDKGYCPSTSPPQWTIHTKPEAKTKAPFADAEYVGQVRIRFVTSDQGYVCVAQVIQSLNDQADAKAQAAIETWRFKPAYQGDRAVPALSTVSFFYWRDPQGHVVATHAITPVSSLP
jgi:TonB family protein